jgi:uncharacterized protein (DUF58 family)
MKFSKWSNPIESNSIALKKTEKNLLSKKALLEIFMNQRVDSPFPGDWESIYKGSGYEFWALRELEPTDPLKHIDWKTTAKTGKYHVREYLAESYFNLMILYDISKSVAFGRKELLQANIAVSLAYTAALSNNGCGMMMFADDVRTYIPPRMGWSHFRQILHTIARSRPVDCPSTNLNHALGKLVNELTGSLTFILSDFLYPIECEYQFQRSLHGTSKHEVSAIQILEEYESRLPPDSKGLISLYDFESGETVLVDLSKWQTYNTRMKRQLANIRHRLNTAGIDSVLITPADNFRLRINEFMQKRTK